MSRQRIYYPEGKIQKGLYTIGKQWMTEDGKEFIGAYHTYTTGEVFSQSSYVRDVSKKLIPYKDITREEIKTSFDYDKLPKKQQLEDYFFPSYSKTTPTQNDYLKGFVNRYFVKSKFNDVIMETSITDYKKVTPQTFYKTTIPWKITGPVNDSGSEPGVEDTNRRLVNLAERDVPQIKDYITNFVEFRKNLTI
jgi:hypothetical protein